MFVSLQNRPRKDVWRCQERKESFLNNEKYVFYIVEKWNIFQRGQPMILVNNLNSLHCLFLLKRGLEVMFGDLLDRKEAFLDFKTIYFI